MTEAYHVYPLNDLRPHYIDSADPKDDGFSNDVPPFCPCLCDPRKEKSENGTWLIIHNSFDGREGVEWANEIISTK